MPTRRHLVVIVVIIFAISILVAVLVISCMCQCFRGLRLGQALGEAGPDEVDDALPEEAERYSATACTICVRYVYNSKKRQKGELESSLERSKVRPKLDESVPASQSHSVIQAHVFS